MADIAVDPSAARAGWRPYQIYVLGLLFLVTVSNFMDRQILGILQEPIKQDLRLSDWQLGVITGPAFALFYSVAGLPIARWAERGHRPFILTLALGFWSGMTALCGFAQNYLQLVLCRVGVGMGEGGCIPTSHSLLSDNFSPRQRGMAMAVLTAGTPVAAFFSPVIGGVVAETWGWRAAFIALGVPGLILAALFFFTVREPRREGTATVNERPRGRFFADIKHLMSQPAFAYLFVATALTGMAVGSTNGFTGSYFIRQYGFSLKQAGLVMALGIGMAGVAGTFIGGYFADRFAGDKGRSYVLVPGIGTFLAGALFLITFSRESAAVALVFLFAANVTTDMKTGPIYAAVQNLAPPQMRATAAAVMMLAMTGLGTGIGPLITGGVSDAVASGAFTGGGDFLAVCPGGRPVGGAPAGLVEACAAASATGLRSGLITASSLYFAATLFFYLSSRKIRLSLGED